MTFPPAATSRREGTFLLADISGYTAFLHGVAEAHRAIVIEADEPPPAYALLSSLLDAMVEKVAPRFRLVKLEGDALFAVADELDEPVPDADGDAVVQAPLAMVRRLITMRAAKTRLLLISPWSTPLR